ncbi:inositol monophosphatase family protein [Nocardia colli]|uniref:inositol monophosphatase family protein n=1 Tax=Nocardia colli TaxID=2545717 RepID=UPI0035D5B77B
MLAELHGRDFDARLVGISRKVGFSHSDILPFGIFCTSLVNRGAMTTTTTRNVELLYAELALAAARKGAEAIGAQARIQETSIKGSRYDLVTSADKSAERAIVDHIVGHHPQDAIMAEETGARSGSSGLRWAIDPIDGTTNFVHGRRDFAVSVGVESDRDGIFAGAIVRPAYNDWAAAEKGRIYSSSVQLQVSSVPINRALVAVGLCHDADARAYTIRTIIPALVSHIQDWRWVGSAACDLFCVAEGSLDGYVGIDLEIWDTAAGQALVEAAGGFTTTVTAAGIPILLAGSADVVEGLHRAITSIEHPAQHELRR